MPLPVTLILFAVGSTDTPWLTGKHSDETLDFSLLYLTDMPYSWPISERLSSIRRPAGFCHRKKTEK
jgi:hypothetical protein